MKKYIFALFFIVILLGCKSNKYDNIGIYRDPKKLNLLIYKDEDSTEIIIPFAFKIFNNSNIELELNPVKPKRKVTFLTEQHYINENNELQIFLFKKIKSKDSLTVIVFGSKKFKNEEVNYPFVKEKSLEEYKKLITIEDYQDIAFKKTDAYLNIIKNLEKDSICFEFTNQVKNLNFYKVGTLEGKTFFTHDTSNR